MQTAAINGTSLSIKYTEWTENIPCIKNNPFLLPSNWMLWKLRINLIFTKFFMFIGCKMFEYLWCFSDVEFHIIILHNADIV